MYKVAIFIKFSGFYMQLEDSYSSHLYRVYQKKRYDFEMLRMSCFLQSRQMTPSGIKIMFNYRLYHVKRFIV